jgi:hypothetical protein
VYSGKLGSGTGDARLRDWVQRAVEVQRDSKK